MNSVPLRVLEYWHRPIVGSEGFRWRRDPSLEVDIVPDWWREAENG